MGVACLKQHRLHSRCCHHGGQLPRPLAPVRRRRQCTAPALHPDHSMLALAFTAIPAVCFDAACQAAADRAFLIAVSIPILIAASAISWIVFRPLPKELVEDGKVFEDPSTGTVFLSPDDSRPERDGKGELAFRPISFTPWPVEDSYEGERVRIPVGRVTDRQPRTYVFSRTLPGSSDIVVVILPRPLGLVFEYDQKLKRTVVVDVIPGTGADQKRRMAQLNPQMVTSAALPGDILRGVTATNFVYPTRALFGAVPPERHIVVYGADRQSWSSVSGALRKGVVKDGDVYLVLERKKGEVTNNTSR